MRATSRVVAVVALLGALLAGAAPALALNTPISTGYAPVAPFNTTIDRGVYPGHKILEEGHSYIAGQQAGAGQNNAYRALNPWETSVTAPFTSAGHTAPTFANTAVGGNTTTDMLARAASDAATHPDHVWVMIGQNDFFNHGGTAIPPSTSQSNTTSYLSTFQSTSPGTRFHYIADLWAGCENWPRGSCTNDSTVDATLAVIKTACQANPFCEYIDIQVAVYSTDMPTQNPGHATCGVLTQSAAGDCTHPTNTPTGGAVLSGQTVISNRVFAATTLHP